MFRTSLSALLTTVLVTGASAHHPGSHATRERDGRIRIEAVAMAADSCTTIASIRPGAPPSVTAPPGAQPVTVQLQRPQDAVCATVVTAAKRTELLNLGADARQLHLYVLGPDGSVVATERVPVR